MIKHLEIYGATIEVVFTETPNKQLQLLVSDETKRLSIVITRTSGDIPFQLTILPCSGKSMHTSSKTFNEALSLSMPDVYRVFGLGASCNELSELLNAISEKFKS